VLPCTVEVLRWFDISALTSLCERQLTGRRTSVLEYGLMLTVKYSMQHAANLTQFCRQSQTSCRVVLAHCLPWFLSTFSAQQFVVNSPTYQFSKGLSCHRKKVNSRTSYLTHSDNRCKLLWVSMSCASITLLM